MSKRYYRDIRPFLAALEDAVDENPELVRHLALRIVLGNSDYGELLTVIGEAFEGALPADQEIVMADLADLAEDC